MAQNGFDAQYEGFGEGESPSASIGNANIGASGMPSGGYAGGFNGGGRDIVSESIAVGEAAVNGNPLTMSEGNQPPALSPVASSSGPDVNPRTMSEGHSSTTENIDPNKAFSEAFSDWSKTLSSAGRNVRDFLSEASGQQGRYASGLTLSDKLGGVVESLSLPLNALQTLGFKNAHIDTSLNEIGPRGFQKGWQGEPGTGEVGREHWGWDWNDPGITGSIYGVPYGPGDPPIVPDTVSAGGEDWANRMNKDSSYYFGSTYWLRDKYEWAKNLPEELLQAALQDGDVFRKLVELGESAGEEGILEMISNAG